MSKSEDIPSLVEESFPAPGFRKYQREAIEEVVEGVYDPDVDVVLVNAPTGSGKSLINETSINAAPGPGFYITPLNSLVDQLANDEFMKDRMITLKGRSNYDCVHPDDRGSPVSEAICQRDSSFECSMKDTECPYYSLKARALGHPEVATNMSYLIVDSMIPEVAGNTKVSFGDREVVVIDECQTTDDQALNFISVTVSRRTTPEQVWKNIRVPSERDSDDMDKMVEWLQGEVAPSIDAVMDDLNQIGVLSDVQSSIKEDLVNFERKIGNFLLDVKDHEWVCEIQTDIRKNKPNEKKAVFQPLEVGRFLDRYIWSRGRTVILSSATIPGDGWLEEIGLGDANIKKVRVPSTFPVENRPIYCDHAVGKMVSEYSDRSNNRKTNAWDMCKKIMQIAEAHKAVGQPNGFIHCRSYSIAELLERSYKNHSSVTLQVPNGEGGWVSKEFDTREWFEENVQVQDRYNRDESLQDWLENDTPVFFSVFMSEGVDLKYDKCHWQALAKTLYPFIDKRMERRKELAEEKGDAQEFWNYYNRKAVIQIQQAYGRGVRADDDECSFYILDQSAITLIKRNAEQFNKWFLEGITDMRINPDRGN